MPKFDGSKPGPGRPKGVPNKATLEFKEWAKAFFTSAAYRRSAEKRMLAGRAPHLESYGLGLLYGKPTEKVEHSGESGGPILLKFGGRWRARDDDSH